MSIVVAGAMLSACGLVDLSEGGDPFVEATADSRRKTCAIERDTVNIALFKYAAENKTAAKSIDQLVAQGFLVSSVGHKMSSTGEVVATGLCANAGTVAAGPGAAPGNSAEMVTLSHQIFQILANGNAHNESYRMSDAEAQCVAASLNESVGKDGAQAFVASKIEAPAPNLVEGVRVALNFCIKADDVAVIFMEDSFEGVKEAVGVELQVTQDVKVCAAEKFRGLAGDLLVSQINVDSQTGANRMVDFLGACFPVSGLEALLTAGLQKGGMPPQLAGCTAKHVARDLGAKRYFEASISPNGQSTINSAVQTAAAKC
ncbi:MAG TPA: hypothetical protein VL068_01355 [Microthrixaceae bacterium]|nr:hypothetical protein [Microthrixaceae bacterium]